MLDFEQEAEGWATAGELLTLISENQAQIEKYLELESGDLDAWVAEFSLEKKPNPLLKRVEFYAWKEIDLDEQVDEPLSLSWRVCGDLQENAHETEKADFEKNGEVCRPDWVYSPLEYWHVPVELNKIAQVRDCRDLDNIIDSSRTVEITLGEVIFAWYDGITWGGETPDDRYLKLEALTGIKDRAFAHPEKLIEYQSDVEAEYKIKMTEQMFDLLVDTQAGNDN